MIGTYMPGCSYDVEQPNNPTAHFNEPRGWTINNQVDYATSLTSLINWGHILTTTSWFSFTQKQAF